jgi:hypothetical protein
METIKEIILLVLCIIVLAMGYLSIRLLLQKFKFITESDNKTKVSYGLWLAVLIITYSVNSTKTIGLLVEAFDTISKLNVGNLYLQMFQTSAIFIGLNIVWFIVWYFFSDLLLMIVLGKRHIIKELENDNISYFLVRGAILFGIVLSFLSVYETLLRVFLPTINVPFYH